ncbi:phage major capsid protein [Mycolicibacterium sp. CH28]|uniref:phage major capsid protein n=1 Tax=Mycolicibacterium sp. CH28 TaxID=2512237 RepID=UPI001386DE49|nr:phage major capsid protein [Mycolicibacterium sp. CH28]
MKTIEEINAARQAIVDTAAAEERNLTDEEYAEFAALEAEGEATRRTEEVRARQAAYMAPNASLQVAAHVAPPKDDDTQTRALEAYLRSGRINADLETRAQNEGTPSAGGILIPSMIETEIQKRLLTYGGVENEAKVRNDPDGRPYQINYNDDTANKAVFVSELATPTTGGADIVYGDPVVLTSHAMTTTGANQNPIALSFQLAEDQPDIVSDITDQIVERFGRGLAAAWVNGNGIGQVHGITTNTVTEATFTAAGPTKNELIDAKRAVDPAYRTDAIWIFNDQTLAAIEKLEDANGRPLWTPAAQAGLETPIGGMLLGHRVVIDQGFADYTDGSTNRWGVFGSIKRGYLCRRVGGMRLVVDQYSGKSKGQIEYTAHIRVDGAPLQPRAYAVLKNS